MKNMKNKVTVFGIIGILFCIITLLIFFYESIYFHLIVRQLDSVESYTSYLNYFPDGKNKEKAIKEIDIFYFNRAISINTVEFYEEYINLQPDGRYVNEAKTKIDDILFDKAKTANTIESYQEYINLQPHGRYVNEAKTKIDDILFDKAKTANTIESYQEYINLQPHGRYVELAKKYIEYLEFKKASASMNVKVLEDFLVAFPESLYVPRAELRIVSLKWGLRSDKKIEEALKYYRIIKSPLANKYDFRTKLFFLKIFVNEYPNSQYLSYTLRSFVSSHVKFTTNEIPLMFTTYHKRKRCANWICTEVYYPRVKDYYAAKVAKDELVIYEHPYIRTVHNIDRDVENIDYLIQDHNTNYVDFRFSYDLCSYDCDASYKSSSGNPLTFTDAFGDINDELLSESIENYLSDNAPANLATAYSKTQLVKSADKTKSYFIVNQVVDTVTSFVEENPLLAAAAAVAIYAALSTDTSSSTNSSDYSSSSSSYSGSSSDSGSYGNDYGLLYVRIDSSTFFGILRDISINVTGQSKYITASESDHCDHTNCDTVSVSVPYDVYDIELSTTEENGSNLISRSMKLSNIKHFCKTTNVTIIGETVSVNCY